MPTYLISLSGPSWVCHGDDALAEYRSDAAKGEAEEPIRVDEVADDDELVIAACERGDCSGGCNRY